MRRFFRWTRIRGGQGVADVFRRSFSAVRSFMPFHQESSLSEEEESRRCGTDSAIRLVLSNDNGDLVESKLEIFRQLIAGDALDKSFAGMDASEFRLDMGFDLHFGDFMFDTWSSLAFVTAVTAVFVVVAVLRMKKN